MVAAGGTGTEGTLALGWIRPRPCEPVFGGLVDGKYVPEGAGGADGGGLFGLCKGVWPFVGVPIDLYDEALSPLGLLGGKMILGGGADGTS